jgi:uncharacterized protein (TIGR03118 family)
MRNLRLYLTVAALIGLSFLRSTTARAGARHLGTNFAANAYVEAGKEEQKNPTQDRDDNNAKADPKGTPVVVLETDLVANLPNLVDRNGILHAPFVLDPNLVNPWGLTESSASPFWVSNNNAGVSTLYSVPGAGNTPVSVNPLVVGIPSPLSPLGADGTPTGAVFNLDLAGQGFKISGLGKGGTTTIAPAVFLFATEDGTIVGWNPGIDDSGKFDGPNGLSRLGVIAVDNSGGSPAANGAVYKGLAIATDATSDTLLYAANFRAGTVEVYDTSFKPVTLPADAFTDPDLPHGYAPFNVVVSGGVLFVTYARQDKAKHDPVAGHGRGFVNTFDLNGQMRARFASRGQLDAPWGVVQAPASFGQFAGDVFIGNFGNGHINAFDPTTGAFLGKVVNSKGEVILIDGLWALLVGNGKNGGDANAIYFTAGPNGETDGLFGSLVPVALGSPCGVPCR